MLTRFVPCAVAVLFACLLAMAADVPSAAQIRYTMPYDGRVTLAIDDAQGVRVRNLVSEAPRGKGEQVEVWDGRDDRGALVKPGSYRWKGLTTKPIHLYYRGTVNCTGTPPWWKSGSWGAQTGAGGWMADHGMPIDVAHIGNTMFLSAGETENGHCIIACNTDGEKRWGAKWFDLAGSSYLSPDNGKMYSLAQHGWGGANPRIWEIDPASFASRQVVVIPLGDGNAYRGDVSGMAARKGKLYVTFNSPEQWLRTGVASTDIDLQQSSKSATTMATAKDNLAPLCYFTRTKSPLFGEWTAKEPKDAVEAAASARYLRLAFKEPMVVGSVTMIDEVTVSALQAEAAFPGTLTDDTQWVTFTPSVTKQGLRVYTAPAGLTTRALRFTLTKTGSVRPALKGMMVLSRRFAAVAMDEAKYSPSMGTVSPQGAWSGERGTPIYWADPATLMISWATPQTFRGMGFLDFHVREAKIDIFTGTGDPAKAADSDWREVAAISPSIFNYGNVPYSDNYVDLQREVSARAVRIRVTRPEKVDTDPYNVTDDRFNRLSLGGVTFFRYLGQDGGPLKDAAQRLSIVDVSTGTVERDIPLPTPRFAKFRSDGTLFLSSGTQVVQLDPVTGVVTPVITTDLVDPRGLAFDHSGNIFVADGGPEVVKIFSPDGKKLLRTIGEPGGRISGPHNVKRIENPQGLDIDPTGQLWVCERDMLPKRHSVWHAATGAFVREFMGPSQYGGGGSVDPQDPSRVYYQGMEFSLDWKSGASKLTHILNKTLPNGDPVYAFSSNVPHPVYHDGRQYMVSSPEWCGWHGAVFQVGRYDNGQVIPCAAFGLAGQWLALQHYADVAKLFADRDADLCSFSWADRNGDGVPQASEVQLGEPGVKVMPYGFGTPMNNDMAYAVAVEGLDRKGYAGSFKPASFTACGAPVYDLTQLVKTPYMPTYASSAIVTQEGHIITCVSPLTCIGPDGNVRWTFPQKVHGIDPSAPVMTGDVKLSGGLGFQGTAEVPGLGEIVCLNDNWGSNHLITADGLYVATLLKDHRAKGARGWYTTEEVKGMLLDDYTESQEAFFGGFTKTADGRYALVAGHNHTSVVEVTGLDSAKRLAGDVVTLREQDIAAMGTLTTPPAQSEARRTLEVTAPKKPVQIDGKLDEWASATFQPLADRGAFAISYDDTHLYLAYRVTSGRPMVNTGADLRMLFKTGDAVSFEVGTNHNANPSRSDPVPGDQRLLITKYQKKPTGVLYEWAAPGVNVADRSLFKSPVRELYVNKVRTFDAANIAIGEYAEGYTVEAAVPLSQLGFTIEQDAIYQADFGIVVGDDAGNVIARVNWANQNSVVADVPTEIQGMPGYWGSISFK